MSPSLRALLAGVLDYAGLFPPARLPLDQAVRNCAGYRQGPDAWMLGRFVIPAARLAELAPLAEELFATGPPLPLAVLGRGSSTADEFLAGLEADLREVAACRQRHGERLAPEVLEVRLPADALGPAGGALLSRTAALLRPAQLAVFGEVSADADLAPLLAELRRLDLGRPIGLKVRTGGLEASVFPTPGQVAGVLRACLDAGVPLKATAGLHHPLRRHDPVLGTRMHGFVNLFAAGALARAHALSAEQIRDVLADEDPEHFAFGAAGLHWSGRFVATAEIAAARQQAVLSFGSCSFDEPRADLRALGWL